MISTRIAGPWKYKLALSAVLGLRLFFPGQWANGYGLLTHQELIDYSWQSTIVPILLKCYPSLSPDQLRKAHSYAYGGSVIQDLGYYPFANVFFSELTHYVRSGDFVRSLFHNAHDADEIAFAIGALAHYFGDSIGHSEATNPSVALAFPKLMKKYGPSVNYAQSKNAHSQVEFAFEVNQAVKQRVAPHDYVGYIGFNVPWDQLAAAFFETYGFPLHDILGHSVSALDSYRFGARSFIPTFTYAEVLLHSHGPDDTLNSGFDLYEQRTEHLAREAEWSRYRKPPGIGAHMLAGLIVILPKVGPAKMLSIKGPTVATETLYVESVNHSTAALAMALSQLGFPERLPGSATNHATSDILRQKTISGALPSAQFRVAVQQTESRVTLPASLVPNLDLDTGKHVAPGGYPLTDQTYVDLLARVTKNPTSPVPEGLKRDILDYYSDEDAPISTKRHPTTWAQVQKQLKVLISMPTTDPSLPN